MAYLKIFNKSECLNVKQAIVSENTYDISPTQTHLNLCFRLIHADTSS